MCTKRSIHVSAGFLRPSSAVLPACLGALVVGALTAGCGRFPLSLEEEVTGSAVEGLQTFESPEEFKQYLGEQVEAQRPTYFEPGYSWEEPAPMPAPTGDSGEEAGQAAPLPEVGAAGGGYSTTNIQESGVDESDVVKNDAAYLYILGDNDLKIVRAVPADDMAVESTVDLPGTPESLFLRGDTAVVIGRDHQGFPDLTTVAVLDVSDRAMPVVEANVDLEGRLIASRLIGPKLHLVLSFAPILPEDQAEAIEEAEFDDLIPDLSVTFHAGSSMTIAHRNLVECREFYRPDDPDGYGVVAVVTLDVDSPQAPIQSAGVMANAGTIYVSPEALYLTNEVFDDAPEQPQEGTEIYKFNLTANGAVPVGSGTIPGRLLNRFSLGEYEGYLRAATTTGHVSRSGGNATNNVYVLAPGNGELSIVGRVENIAPGERIYAARFIGARGFLVTFKKVDPLFTLDFSQPTSPAVVGELKVPGYSDYIHPLGKNHLLTIGKDAVDVGDFAWYQGVQLSVFDVTDFSNPQRVDAEIIGERGTESEALHEPHAFNFFAPVNMLAIPMEIAEGAGPDPSSHGQITFEGLCLFQVLADEGIEPLGQIPTTVGDEWYYSGAWTRGIFIGEYVYAVTGTRVQAVPLANLDAEPFQLPLD